MSAGEARGRYQVRCQRAVWANLLISTYPFSLLFFPFTALFLEIARRWPELASEGEK